MKYISYEKKGKVAYIMLDISDMNQIDYAAVGELHDIWIDFQGDDNLWVGILGSLRKNFTCGFDIKKINEILKKGDFSWNHSCMFGEKRLGPDGHGVTKPLIAALNGIVNGAGIWLTFQSDIRIATPETLFGLAEGRLNFPVEFTNHLMKYLPRALINEMLFTAKNIKSQRFYDLGIINKIVEKEDLMNEADKIAEAICESGPTSVRVMKQLVKYSYEMEHHELMKLAVDMIVPVVNSEDTREAVNSFIEKRKPEWKMK
jgi:enoyl-CoA hydratase/carnithine racemase